jgi:hypothetical protein
VIGLDIVDEALVLRIKGQLASGAERDVGEILEVADRVLSSAIECRPRFVLRAESS